jgi:hypothetical protein
MTTTAFSTSYIRGATLDENPDFYSSNYAIKEPSVLLLKEFNSII